MDVVESQGARIPKIGFGTFQLPEDVAKARTRDALAAGYRHIDTAQMYGNEGAVGEAIRESDVSRSDLFVTTKVWVDRFQKGDLQRSVEESLGRLGLEHVDLVLLHWPNTEVPLSETIAALNDARQQGMTRHIGVSNFNIALLREAMAASEAPLVTNQVEYHPRLSQAPLLAELRRHNMALTAYCPIGQGKSLDSPGLARIAERHGKEPAQVVIRWHYQQPGVIAIPRSSKAERVRSNLDILDFELSEEEMAAISGLASENGRLISPSGLAPQWDNAS